MPNYRIRTTDGKTSFATSDYDLHGLASLLTSEGYLVLDVTHVVGEMAAQESGHTLFVRETIAAIVETP